KKSPAKKAVTSTADKESNKPSGAAAKKPAAKKSASPSKFHPGDLIADFTLQDQDGNQVRLSSFAGQPVVLFFYPRANTPGCTIEACGFRDTFKKIQSAGAAVLGISRDTVKDQKKFQQKYDLPYPLLADPDRKICE